jgi:hypothetical protein
MLERKKKNRNEAYLSVTRESKKRKNNNEAIWRKKENENESTLRTYR